MAPCVQGIRLAPTQGTAYGIFSTVFLSDTNEIRSHVSGFVVLLSLAILWMQQPRLCTLGKRTKNHDDLGRYLLVTLRCYYR